ncbi:hypothetical protein BS50DRAFT_674788 [Corynespora cassiicola Philippines]|uniref:RING-type domain-containing protein n=1 Tax=Corynespora cassiicola Philippines TaxID=1448308 RepID=A0A2T2NZ90_CORCC|nr:hypothetical protein BS50DRAFT_674788 [Corynespora cassiicola Philippines]
MGIRAPASFQQPQQAYTLVERPATLQGPLDFHHSQRLPPRIVTVTPSSIRAESRDSPTGASSAPISARGPGSQATGHSRRENTLLPASHLDGTEGMLHDVELNSDLRNGRQAEKAFHRAFERVRAWNRDHQKGLTNYELEALAREFVAEHEAQSTRYNAARMVQDNHRTHDGERQIPDRVLGSSSAAMDSAGRPAPAARHQATAESISDSLDSSTEFFETYDGPGVMDYSRSDEKPGDSFKRHDSSAWEQKSSPSHLNMDSFSAEISNLESHIGRSSFNPWDTSNEDTSLMHMLNRTPNHALQEAHASPVEHSNRKRVTFAESNTVEPHRAQTSVSSQRTRTPPQGSCALCKVPYTLNRRRENYTLECGHSMHRDCLTDHFRMLDRKNEFCPIPGCEVFLCETSRYERVAADQKAIFGNQHTRVGPLFISVNFDDGDVAQCKNEESLVTTQLHLLREYLKKHVNSAWQTSLERRKSVFDFYQIVQDTVRDFSDVVLRSPSKYLPCCDVLLRFVAWAELTRLMNNRQSAILRHEQNTMFNTMFPPLRSLHDEFHRSKLIYDEQKVTWSRNQEGTLDCERVADFSYGLAMKSFQRPSQSQ